MYELVNDATLGILIEDMETAHVEGNLDGVACTRGGSGGYTRDESGLLTNVKVEVDLSTHKLGYVNVSLKLALGMVSEVDGLIVNSLGTETCNNFLTDVILEVGVVSLLSGKLDGEVLEVEVYVLTLLLELTVDEVHLRSADEACNEDVYRVVIEVLRSINLLDKTVLHNYDTGSHSHSLDLVVSNVDKGGSNVLVKLGKLGSHRCTELSVEVGERLVKKEYLGLTNDCTTKGNTLLLTTGKSLGLSVEKVCDVEDTSSLFYAALDLFLGSLVKLKAECHVLKYGHMRIKSVVLENHRDLSILRSYVVNELVADEELTLGDLLKTCYHSKSGGLTATGRTYEYEKLLVLDFKIEVRNSGNAAGVLLIDVLKGYTCHL